jgi:hypothetical protein
MLQPNSIETKYEKNLAQNFSHLSPRWHWHQWLIFIYEYLHKYSQNFIAF